MITSPEVSTNSDITAKAELALKLYRLKILIFHYWWVVALSILVGLAIQGYRWNTQIPEYVSNARMMVNGQLNFGQGAQYNELYENFSGTQIALMKSQTTVSQAVDRVHAMHSDIAVDNTVSVAVTLEPRTSIFDLQVIANNDKYAEALLTAIMDTYLSNKRGRRDQTTDEAVTAITGDLANLDSEIKSDEQALLDFQKENNVVFIEQQSANAATYLVGLNDEMARLTKDYDLLTLGSKDPVPSAGDSAQSGNDKNMESSDNPAVRDAMAAIQEQQTKIEKLKILREDYSTYLKDMHPKMIALADEITQEERFLDILKSKDVEAREGHIADLELQIKNLEKQIADWNAKSLDLNQRLVSYQQLKANLNRETNMYDQLAASFQNVNVNKSIDQTTVSILDQASPGTLIPVSLTSFLIYGIILGFIAGIAIIFIINRLDDTIHSPIEIEENFTTPLAGQIPLADRDKRTKRVPLITEQDDRHYLTESFRDIRSFILFRTSAAHRPRSILICSAEPNEGKSTLAANLAITFALTGSRVLIIDADMRRGLLHTYFETPVSPGLSEYLDLQAQLNDVIYKTNQPTLDMIPRGKVPHQPGELLLSQQIDNLFEQTHADYDIVFWDSVPILAADDVSNLCSKVDGIIFVVRAGYSSIYAAQGALDILSPNNSQILGMILNSAILSPPGYYTKYRYKQYYSTKAKD
jgi:capsular exopolysaccharide synthesis family protein